jgi:hypothetical protein
MDVADQEITHAELLESILETLDRSGHLEDSQMVTPLGSRQCYANVTIGGINYSLTLTRED